VNKRPVTSFGTMGSQVQILPLRPESAQHGAQQPHPMQHKQLATDLKSAGN
jgi:hypothetical protein